MKLQHYFLEGKKVVVVDDINEWLRRKGPDENSVVAETTVGDTHISTVLLPFNHNYLPNGTPLKFETMTFGGMLDDMQWRYATYEEAEAGHAEVVKIALEAQAELDKLFLIAITCDSETNHL